MADLGGKQRTAAEENASLETSTMSTLPQGKNGPLVFSRLRITTIAGLAVLALSLLVFLTARNAGMYPSVFADEWFYNLFSRLYDIKFAQRPSYLYFGVYSVTNRCGDGFLECARLINALFFVAAIPLIYSLARKYLTRALALWVTALSVFSPINAYSAYFMPESMYYFGFFLFAWITLKGAHQKPLTTVILAGCTLGAMTMIKVHAVFLLPGLWAILLLPLLSKPDYKIAAKTCGLILLSIVAFLCFRLGVGYLAVGNAGFHILGTDYTATAKSASGMEQVRHLLPLIGYNLWGNILALAVMFALPLALLLNIDTRSVHDDERQGADLRGLKFFTGTLLALLLLITAVFFARVQGTSPYENIARLSLRYYDFLFPLLYIIAGVTANQITVLGDKNYFKIASIGGIALIAAYAVWTRLGGYLPGIADSPELRAFTYNPYVYSAIGTLGIICSAIALFRLRVGATLFIWFFLPLTILLSAHFTNKELHSRLVSDPYDEAGQFVQRYLGPDVAKLAIVAPELSSIFRTHFYLRTPENTFINLPNHSRVDSSAIPANIEWILMMGSYQIPFELKQSVQIPVKAASLNLSNYDLITSALPVKTYTLVQIASTLTVDFLHESLPPALTHVDGLSTMDPVGRWSIGKEIVLTFSKPLPKRFELAINAFALGPNAEQAIKIDVGGNQYNIVLASQPSTVKISVVSGRNDNKIKIEIPQPTSPKDLGLSADTRTLGVGLKLITIREPIQITQ
jgi:phosphoglycerol transferase